MFRLTAHMKSGKQCTLSFGRDERARMVDILVDFADWSVLGAASSGRTMIDEVRGADTRVVIPFASIEWLESE